MTTKQYLALSPEKRRLSELIDGALVVNERLLDRNLVRVNLVVALGRRLPSRAAGSSCCRSTWK